MSFLWTCKVRGCGRSQDQWGGADVVPKRRDRPVLKIDHEDRRSEKRRDDEEHRLRHAIGERRKTLHRRGR